MVSITSSARTIRRTLPGSTRDAASGSSARQPFVGTGHAVVGRRGALERGARLEVAWRNGEPVDNGPHVQTGAADEQCPPAPGLDVGQGRERRALRLAHRPFLRRIGDVDEVVANRGTISGRRLRGTDVHPPVHLHRVERDDLDIIEGRGHRERDRRLARRGRTDDREVAGHTTAIGMRTRRRGAALT